MAFAKNVEVETKTVGIATATIPAYSAVTYSGTYPTVAGEPVAGFTNRLYVNGEAIGAISLGEAWAISGGVIAKGDKLFAMTDGRVSAGLTTEVVAAVALEAASAAGKKIKVNVVKNGLMGT